MQCMLQIHSLGWCGFGGDSGRAGYNVSLGIFKFCWNFFICNWVFSKFPVGLALVVIVLCFFPAIFALLETHKVTSNLKRQWQFWDVGVISPRGINCIRVFAWRTEHLSPNPPMGRHCSKEQHVLQSQPWSHQSSGRQRGRKQMESSPLTPTPKYQHLHPFHENWPHQTGHSSDGCGKCFATLIHNRVTQIRDTLVHTVSEQQGLAGWHWRSSKNLPSVLAFWHSSSAFQKPDGTDQA